ncbi:uncharacterized protein BXZ73DRAFT_91875 [Epithele typhae]|uniref:uncharacterized protein n=1 Tax=Epithele typhae TaxID=378194 RepID=UPI002008D256|nr:uncharacterized protein BXZ73DRAFT_91875 [Epithele typhae]KAH9920849.1 hypothetical protein BXZ73DRAFT_91875 [Epithele typhae]
MKLSFLLLFSLRAPPSRRRADLQATVKANWDSAYVWTADQLEKAQVTFQNVKDNTFDSWDESRLREFLLEQGVVNPSGPREQLALLAKQKWRQYNAAASSYSSTASASASSINSLHQASKSASSYVAQATAMWDDNRIRTWLEEHGMVSPPATPRGKLLAKMRDTYVAVTKPIWQAWSDSYIHQWLLNHQIIKDSTTKRREELVGLMEKYYYDVNEKVWQTWSDSQAKQWLVEHDVIKSDAQPKREKMEKLIADNYVNSRDVAWGAWNDSDMRSWLIEHGYLRSDAQKKRDELVKLMNDKYTQVHARSAAYLTWPDARLRAYLRENGISDAALPTSRPGLLQEVRVRWVEASWRASSLWRTVMDYFDSGVEIAEDKLGMILEILSGGVEGAKDGARDKQQKYESKTKVEL